MTQQLGQSGARMLLKRLRNVMARGGTAEQRLNQIVKLIAADMVAEVCSTYVMRAGEVLELFATEGLKQTAVHKTRLRVGEGLVGDIASHARPLALADAQHHPLFAYRPETGEEIYQSLMGVPILRGGRVIGVLVIQNKNRRQYSDEEVETLETIAMVVAELVASGELIGAEELRPGDGNALLPVRLEGLVLSPGMALGTAVLHAPDLRLQQLIAEDSDLEINRLNEAVAGMRAAIDEMLASSDLAAGGEHREVLESYRMFAEDTGWVNRMVEAIGTGLTAEAAVQKVQNDMRARMRDVSDPYLRERLSDLDDLANRLLKHLIGGEAAQGIRIVPDDAILIARNMGPAELLDYDRQKLRGLALEEGAASSHVAIVARALGVAVLGRCNGLLAKVSEGDPLALDGDHGQLFVRPPEDIQQVFATSLQQRAKRQEAYAAVKDLPAVTLDGVGVTLSMNAGLLIDVPQLAITGAAGIGLYRTEIPFMVAHEFPDTKRQADIYRKALDSAEGRPIVFRTLDIGSDKVLPYWQRAEEENPAMGWRAIRISLDRPALLRQQLRALILAADGRDLRVMFPMVTEVAEFDACRALLDIELRRSRDRGLPLPASLQVGAMIEVPSLLWQLDDLLKRVDFVSVGSNDLKQFIYAADRGTPSVNERYDILSPAMIRLLGQIAAAAKQFNKTLSLCGEMAGDPIGAMALLCLGYRNLSMTPPSVGPVRMMIRSLHLRQLQDYWATLDGLPGAAVRSSLTAFALDHAIQI